MMTIAILNRKHNVCVRVPDDERILGRDGKEKGRRWIEREMEK